MWFWFALSATGCSSTPVNDNQAGFCTEVRTLVAQNEMSCTLTLPGIRVQLKCPSERLQGGSLSSACQYFFFFFSFFFVYSTFASELCEATGSHSGFYFLCASIEVQINCRPERHERVLLLPVYRRVSSGEPKTKDLCTLPEWWCLSDGSQRRWLHGFPLESPPPCLICYKFCFMDALGGRVINASCFEFVCWGLLWYNLLMWLLDWIKKKMPPPPLTATLFLCAITECSDIIRLKFLIFRCDYSAIILLWWAIKFK